MKQRLLAALKATHRLTDNKKHLNNHIEGAQSSFIAVLLEGRVVGNHDGEVEGTEHNQPVPDYFKDAVVQEDTPRGL